jgi:hypothetical protein
VGIDVVAADGRRWTVERHFQWPGWRQLGRNFDEDELFEFTLLGDSSPIGIFVGFVLALLAALVIVLVLPLLLLIVEVALAVAAFLVFRGTWIVDSTTLGPPPERKAWKVRGPRRSKRAAEEVASELRAGLEAAPASGEPMGSDPAQKA